MQAHDRVRPLQVEVEDIIHQLRDLQIEELSQTEGTMQINEISDAVSSGVKLAESATSSL